MVGTEPVRVHVHYGFFNDRRRQREFKRSGERICNCREPVLTSSLGVALISKLSTKLANLESDRGRSFEGTATYVRVHRIHQHVVSDTLSKGVDVVQLMPDWKNGT